MPVYILYSSTDKLDSSLQSYFDYFMYNWSLIHLVHLIVVHKTIKGAVHPQV